MFPIFNASPTELKLVILFSAVSMLKYFTKCVALFYKKKSANTQIQFLSEHKV